MQTTSRPRCSRPDAAPSSSTRQSAAAPSTRPGPGICARRHALLGGVALLGGRRFVSGGAVASAAVDELPLVPKSPLAPGLNISQVLMLWSVPELARHLGLNASFHIISTVNMFGATMVASRSEHADLLTCWPADHCTFDAIKKISLAEFDRASFYLSSLQLVGNPSDPEPSA